MVFGVIKDTVVLISKLILQNILDFLVKPADLSSHIVLINYYFIAE